MIRPVSRFAGFALVIAGTAVLAFYLFSFNVSGSGQNGPDNGWEFEAAYNRTARRGIAAGAAIVIAGVLVECERRRR